MPKTMNKHHQKAATTMTHNTTAPNTAVPALRFPEFRGDKGWVEKKLGDIARITMGSSPKSIYYNDKGIGLPLLQGNADIKNRVSAPRIYTQEITKECQVGDILLSVRAPVGSVAKAKHHACIGRGITAIRFNKAYVQEFFYQWLISFENGWEALSQGGTFSAVNSSDIKSLTIFCPNEKEQQKIAECLASIDAQITAEGDYLQALHSHKQGLLQQLFPTDGDTVPQLRFNGFNRDWEEGSISDFIKSLDAGVSVNSIDEPAEPHEVGVLKTSSINSGFFYESENKKVHEENEKSRLRESVKANTIIISRMNTPNLVGENAFIDRNFSNLFLPDRLWAAKPKKNKCLKFLAFFLGAGRGRILLKELATGTSNSMKNITKSDVMGLKLLAPQLEEQQTIADCLSSLDDLITAQTDKIDALKQHKQGLMQQLFPRMDK